MKLLQYNKIASMFLIALSFAACVHEDTPGESQLDYTQPVKTELDNWIVTNYLNPFNINVIVFSGFYSF